MNIPDMSQVDWAQVLGWVSSLSAVAAAAGAIISAFVARKVYLSQTSPDVIVFMDGSPNDEMIAQLFVRNVGEAPAYDIEVSISPTLPCHECAKESILEGFLAEGVAFLQPGGERRTFLNVFSTQLEEMGDTVFMASVAYSDRLGKRFEGSFPIEGRSFRGASGDEPKIEKYLRSISVSLNAMSKDAIARDHSRRR